MIWGIIGSVVPFIMWVVRVKTNESDEAVAQYSTEAERRIAPPSASAGVGLNERRRR